MSDEILAGLWAFGIISVISTVIFLINLSPLFFSAIIGFGGVCVCVIMLYYVSLEEIRRIRRR